MNFRSQFPLIALAGAIVVSAGPNQVAASKKQYESPDKMLIASVVATNTGTAIDNSESRVEVHSATGELLAQEDFTSQDGEHGFAVVKAEWTPDSQFFVFSLEDSGGHSPWHAPVKFYARKQQKILSLDDALHDAVNGEFIITAPDKVTARLWFRKKKVTVSLAEIAEAATSRGQ